MTSLSWLWSFQSSQSQFVALLLGLLILCVKLHLVTLRRGFLQSVPDQWLQRDQHDLRAPRATRHQARPGHRFWLRPQRLLGQAEANLSRSRIPPARRAERAWVAGSWARAVLDGRVSSPNCTETIGLGSRFWVVLRCSSCSCPSVFTTSAAFFAAVGRWQDPIQSPTHFHPRRRQGSTWKQLDLSSRISSKDGVS